jgi:hypothetical protein
MARSSNSTIPKGAEMSKLLNQDLPGPLQRIETRPLFVMRLNVKGLLIVGAAPGVFRRVGAVPSGVRDVLLHDEGVEHGHVYIDVHVASWLEKSRA